MNSHAQRSSQVAHAHEGIAKVLTKQGQHGAAQDHIDLAIYIKEKQAEKTSKENTHNSEQLTKLQEERDKMEQAAQQRT